MSTKLIYLHKIERNIKGLSQNHVHDYWQLEIITSGDALAILADERILLNTGDMLLINPGLEHSFVYKTSGINWISIKFETSEVIPFTTATIIRPSLFTGRLISSLRNIIHSNILEDFEKKAVTGFIESLICYMMSDTFLKSENKNKLAEDISGYIIGRNGKPVMINELAKALSYTRNYLSQEFKKETGQTLKSHIDMVRFEKAKEMLLYSGFSILDISIELGFKDIYSFSRFFKNNAGICPNDYRRGKSKGCVGVSI